MKSKMQRLLFLLCLLLVLTSGNAAYAIQPGVPNAPTLFTGLIRKLQKQSDVPLRIPSYIPKQGQFPYSQDNLKVYANLIGVSDNEYSIILGFTKDCAGGNACRLGRVEGLRVSQAETPLAQAFQDSTKIYTSSEIKSQEAPAKVNLDRGLTGYFLPWICGANCSDAVVIWEENGFRYTVGIKTGDQASLIKMANSAIPD